MRQIYEGISLDYGAEELRDDADMMMPPPDFVLRLRIHNRYCLSQGSPTLHSEQFVTSVPLVLADNSAQIFVFLALSRIGIPNHVIRGVVSLIVNMYHGSKEIEEGDSNNTVPVIVATIDLKLLLSNEEAERLVIRLSQREHLFEPVPATESSIEELKKTNTVVVVVVDDDDVSNECTICMEKIEGGVEAIVMPCSHIYHGSCIVRWLQTSHMCPLCRFQMPTDKKR